MVSPPARLAPDGAARGPRPRRDRRHRAQEPELDHLSLARRRVSVGRVVAGRRRDRDGRLRPHRLGVFSRTWRRARRARVSAAGGNLRARTLDRALAPPRGVLRADARVHRARGLREVPAGPRADARPRDLAGPAGTDAGADDRHRRRARVLARETPGQRVDRAAHLVAVDDGLGDLALVGVVLLRDHEHGDVADRGVGDDPLAGFGPQRATCSASPPRSDGDSRRGR